MSAALRLASSRLFFFTFSTVSENAFRCSSLFKESSQACVEQRRNLFILFFIVDIPIQDPGRIDISLPVPVKYLLSHLMVQRFLKIIRSNDTINLFK